MSAIATLTKCCHSDPARVRQECNYVFFMVKCVKQVGKKFMEWQTSLLKSLEFILPFDAIKLCHQH